jgi:hypothetical protein
VYGWLIQVMEAPDAHPGPLLHAGVVNLRLCADPLLAVLISSARPLAQTLPLVVVGSITAVVYALVMMTHQYQGHARMVYLCADGLHVDAMWSGAYEWRCCIWLLTALPKSMRFGRRRRGGAGTSAADDTDTALPPVVWASLLSATPGWHGSRRRLRLEYSAFALPTQHSVHCW